METSIDMPDEMPVVSDLNSFDRRSGTLVERAIFNSRYWFLLMFLIAAVLLGHQASGLRVNAAFDKMIPQDHPYIQNYFKYRGSLSGQGNVLRVVVENTKGDIFDPAFLDMTRKINDALYLTHGVDRSWMQSIWMSATRWTEVTEAGFRGGPVMPDDYDGSPRTIEALRHNVRGAGIVGSLVGTDLKSIMLVAPLQDIGPDGKRLDYGELSRQLEAKLRGRFESPAQASRQGPTVKIHIVGFAKLAGDLIDGLLEVMTYFAGAAAIAALAIFLYTRCVRSTVLVVCCSIVAVVMQLGIVTLLGFELDPYSILVPFLIFAIGVSHGAQKMNGVMQDIGRGTHKYVAARYTFRRLFLAGLSALLANAVGFAVLTIIDIPVIRDLALTASIGVAVLIFTNLMLLPVLLSYTGVTPAAARASLGNAGGADGTARAGLLVSVAGRFTSRRWATGALVAAAALTVIASLVSLHLHIGDLDPGAPELRTNSRYNRDVAYINGHYGLSGDQLIVYVKVPEGECSSYQTLKQVDDLAWTLRQVPGVRSTAALPDSIVNLTSGLNEANPKWLALTRSEFMLNGATQAGITNNPDKVDTACSLLSVAAYLTDHKAVTLSRVLASAEQFAGANNGNAIAFLPASGSAGIEAVTNVVVSDSILKMYAAVYGAVALLCFITFRNWRAVLIALIPLIITSILCKALMVVLGIGLKVATLPVIALGVGIGVDYALYLLSVQLSHQRAGLPLAAAYRKTLAFTGKVVGLVGITLTAAMVPWVWSPIKFQADMGILLAFMFLWNMVGALILVPALSHFLLRETGKRGKGAGSAAGLPRGTDRSAAPVA